MEAFAWLLAVVSAWEGGHEARTGSWGPPACLAGGSRSEEVLPAKVPATQEPGTAGTPVRVTSGGPHRPLHAALLHLLP